MLTIHTNKNAAGLVTYFTNALSKDDYFFTGSSIPGRWHGQLAKELSLPEKVSQKDFSSLAHNKHPKTGEKLTVRNAAERRTSVEYTFSAPKSVSLIMALSPHGKEVLSAHRFAVRVAMREIEKDMHTQTRINGQKTYVKTGNIVYARFDHFTSRPVKDNQDSLAKYSADPQLHSHCVVFSCTQYNGRFQAIESSPIRRVAGYYEAIYHAHLSKSMQKLGYEILRTKNGWEVRSPGLTRATIEKFSRRTMEIEKLAKKLGISDPKAKGQLGARSRLNKAKAKDDLDLKALWRSRLTAIERKAIENAKGKARPPVHEITPQRAIERALSHHLERQSAVPVKKLLGHALKLGYGSLSLDQVEAALKDRTDILTAQKGHLEYLTTKDMVRAENRMIDFASTGKNIMKPIHPAYTPKPSFLNDQQKSAIQQILNSKDRVSILSGAAGVGKSTLLVEIKQAAEQRGKRVLAMASSSSASRDVLRQKGFKDADTIAAFLRSKDLQDKAAGQILLVDEASLVGVKTMNKVFDTARKINARVILSGDALQHTSPEHGDALKLLQEKSRLKIAAVDQILRQRHNPDLKRAIELLSKKKMKKGFDRLDKMGAVIEISDHEQRMARVAEAYSASLLKNRTALVVSPTHAEGMSLTEAIRDKLKTDERIQGKEQSFTVYKPLSFTEAQKKDVAHYEPGMNVQFHQNAPGFKAGKRYEVSKIKDNQIFMQAPGENLHIPLPIDTQAERFQVFQPQEIKLAHGDVIRITNNGRSREKTRLYNGQRYEISGFTTEGHIQLSTGKILDKDFGHLTYGYVQTSHAAQGKDAQDVYVVQSHAMSFGATNEKQFYVSASRASERLNIFTDDKEALREAVCRSGDRISAGEIARRADISRKRNRRRYYFKTLKHLSKDERSKLPPQKRIHRPVIDKG